MAKSVDIKCGEWRCQREAKWVPRLFNLDFKPSGVTLDEDERQARADRAIQCGVHGPGPDKRRGLTDTWEPIENRPDVVEAARKYRRLRRQQQDAAAAEEQAREKEKSIKRIERDWSVVGDDYEVVYTEGTTYRHDEANPQRLWSIWPVGVPAEEREYPHVYVEVSTRTVYGLPEPAELRTTNGSHPDPKMARAIAAALLLAADAVERLNRERRAEYERIKRAEQDAAEGDAFAEMAILGAQVF